MSYTKGRWYLVEVDGEMALSKTPEPQTDDDLILFSSEWLNCSEDDMKRIVACVSYCAGLPTETLEDRISKGATPIEIKFMEK